MAKKTVQKNHAIVTDEEAYQENLKAAQEDQGSAKAEQEGEPPAESTPEYVLDGDSDPKDENTQPSGQDPGKEREKPPPPTGEVFIVLTSGASLKTGVWVFQKDVAQPVPGDLAARLLGSGLFKEA